MHFGERAGYLRYAMSTSTTCRHDGFQSGQGRYDHATQQLRYVIVCDTCNAELRVVFVQRYVPGYDPHGNDAHAAA